VDKLAMTYKLNYNIFHNIENEAQAYCLGCFYFHPNGRLQLSPQNIEILSIISNILEYDGPIRTYNNIVELNISQTRFVSELNFDHTKLPDIPSSLLHHFVRAIFDLYGSIYLVKNKYVNVNIVQREDFINELRLFLKDTLNIDTKHYYRYSYTNTIQMMITASPSVKKFMNWLYQDANYYLTRKFTKYQGLLKKGV